MTTISKQITLGTDDCYETNDTTLNTSNTNLYVGYFSSVFDIGLRWQSIGIKRCALINSATLSLRTTTDAGTLAAVIKGIGEDDPATWSSTTRPSQRSKTSAEVSANEADWTNWGLGNWAEIDVTSIVQEIVNRTGWAEGNDLAMVLEDLAGAGSNFFGSYSYEGDSALAPKLEIDFTACSTTLPTCAIIVMELDGTAHTITAVQELQTSTELSNSTDSFEMSLLNEGDAYSYIEKGCRIEVNTGVDGLTEKIDGFVTEVTRTLDDTGINPILHIAGEDGEIRLNNIIFSGRFFDFEVSALLKAILDSDDFTTGETLRTLADLSASNAEIEATAYSIDEATYAWRQLGSVIQELAGMVGYEWYRDTDKILHFFNPSNKAVSHTIVDADLDGVPELQAVGDIVNRAIVIGGFEQATDQDGSTQTSTTTVTSTVAKNQSFTPTEDYLGSVLVYTELVTDSDSDLKISVQEDSSGSPSGVNLANGQMTLKLDSIVDGDYTEFRFKRDVTLTPGDTYWIVLDGTDADGVDVGVAGATLDFMTRYPVRVAVMANDADSQETYANADGSPGIYSRVLRDESIEDSQLAEVKAGEMLMPYPKVAGSILVHGDSIKAGDLVQLTVSTQGVDINKTMKVRSSTQEMGDNFIYNSLELEEV
jgi:hypothetical protein